MPPERIGAIIHLQADYYYAFLPRKVVTLGIINIFIMARAYNPMAEQIRTKTP
jgi:hypothetical protein